MLQSDLSARACKEKWAKPSYSPLASVSARLNGGDGPALPFPSCTWGLPRDTVRELSGAADTSAWCGVSSEMGRGPSDSRYCAYWRALFESFAPPERVSAPAYRHLLHARHAVVRATVTSVVIKKSSLSRTGRRRPPFPRARPPSSSAVCCVRTLTRRLRP